MRIMNLIELPQAIPMSVLMGANGSQDVIDRMNAVWRGSNSSGMIFGEGVFGDRYKIFTEMVTSRQQEAIQAVEKTVQSVMCPDKFQLIDSYEALEHVPMCMQIPILTYAPVRKLYDQGLLRGWDIPAEEMPEDDPAGRMINNGRWSSADEEWMKDPERGVEYTIKTGDPDYTQEQLDMIESSRVFIDSWLEEQLGPGGDHLDLTDLPNQMGKLRSPDGDDE